MIYDHPLAVCIKPFISAGADDNAEVRALVVFVLGVFCGDWLSNLPDAHPRSPLPDPRRSLRPWARGSYHPVCPIPLGCSFALALGALLHALSLRWSSILHMVMYMFQCYSLKSSHPHLLPHSPKVVLCTCVSFAVLLIV